MQLSGPQISNDDLQRAGAMLQQSLLIGLLASGHVLLDERAGAWRPTTDFGVD